MLSLSDSRYFNKDYGNIRGYKTFFRLGSLTKNKDSYLKNTLANVFIHCYYLKTCIVNSYVACLRTHRKIKTEDVLHSKLG